MENLLQNIKVLDFTRVLAGPFASQIMGDLGAEVIKVEPIQGDESRTWPPILAKGESGYFCAINRNKRAITLNLKDKRGQKIVNQLKKEGAEAIILGCTDIPILLKPEDVDIEAFDTVEVLAESTIKYAVK